MTPPDRVTYERFRGQEAAVPLDAFLPAYKDAHSLCDGPAYRASAGTSSPDGGTGRGDQIRGHLPCASFCEHPSSSGYLTLCQHAADKWAPRDLRPSRHLAPGILCEAPCPRTIGEPAPTTFTFRKIFRSPRHTEWDQAER
jgi:hypothetical protein